MNYNEIEKSKILANLAGFGWNENPNTRMIEMTNSGTIVAIYNVGGNGLYGEHQMHNARKIIAWAMCNTNTPQEFFNQIDDWLKQNAYYAMYHERGIADTLDVILQSAIKHGMAPHTQKFFGDSAINSLTDIEKSRLLANLIGWRISDLYDATMVEDVQTAKILGGWNFYDSIGAGFYGDGHTDVARRIFRWALFPEGKPPGFNDKIDGWFRRHSFFTITHPMGFRTALDKILQYAIEENMITCKK